MPEFVTVDNPSKLFLVLCTHVAVEQSFDKLPMISSDDFRGNFIIREPYDTGVVNVVILAIVLTLSLCQLLKRWKLTTY